VCRCVFGFTQCIFYLCLGDADATVVVVTGVPDADLADLVKN
jgi:hypothetical protein